MTDVAVVHLGRPRARGEVRRVRSWCEVLAAADLDVAEVPVSRRPFPDPAAVAAVVAGRAVPESLAWSGRALRAALDALDPRVVLVVSSRAFGPRALAGRRVVLDLVDPLDRAYRDRSALTRGLRSSAYRVLAGAHGRVQRRLRDSGPTLTVAGWSDATDLGVAWLPITVAAGSRLLDTSGADHDLVFTGTLSYPPNIASLQRLARLWPTLRDRRPRITLLVAGSGPTTEVRDLCLRTGWTLIADFAAPDAILARGRVAVAPLDHAAGLQIKVLDAAAHGIPQVVSPAALGGFAPDFGLPAAATDGAFVDAVLGSLAAPDEAAAVARAFRTRVLADYGVDRWAPVARELLDV